MDSGFRRNDDLLGAMNRAPTHLSQAPSPRWSSRGGGGTWIPAFAGMTARHPYSG